MALVVLVVIYYCSPCCLCRAPQQLVTEIITSGQAVRSFESAPSVFNTEPEFRQGLDDLAVEIGEPFELTVHVEGFPQPSISWWHNQVLVRCNSDVELSDLGSRHCLRVRKSSLSYFGQYKCVAANNAGESVCVCSVQPNQPNPATTNTAPFFVTPVTDQHVSSGQDVEFKVEFRGDPVPDIKWMKDDIRLTEDYGVELDSTDTLGFLRFPDASRDDAGTYSCILSNSVGTESSSARLDVATHAALTKSKSSDSKGKSSSPSFKIKPSDVDVKEDGTCQLEAQILGKPEPVVTWMFGGKKIKSVGRYTVERSDKSYKLLLRNAESKHDGVYTVTAKNKHGCVEASARLTVLKGVSAPRFLRLLNDVSVVDGSSCYFMTRVEGRPTPVVKWYKDDVFVKDGAKYMLSSTGDRHNLSIPNVTMDDTGTFKCVATNCKGEVSCTAFCLVNNGSEARPPSFSVGMRAQEVAAGSPAHIDVILSGSPLPTVSWFKDNELINEDERFQLKSDGQVWSLVIGSASPADSGVYKCEAINCEGIVISEATVEVIQDAEAPSFAKPLKDAVIASGNHLKLDVEVQGNSPVDVTWYFNGTELVDGRNDVRLSSVGDRHTLVVRRLTSNMAGEYICKASNDIGSDATSCEVTVKDTMEAPEFILGPVAQAICEGEEAVFVARFSGVPTPSVHWYKNGTLLKSSDCYDVDTEDGLSTLIVKNVSNEDIGLYCCEAKNERGYIRSEALLKVIEKQDEFAPEFTSLLEDMRSRVGGRICFQVGVIGQPEPRVKWSKDGLPVESGTDRIVTSQAHGVYKLDVHNVSVDDSGCYECVASNKCGEITCQSIISVGTIEEQIEAVRRSQDELDLVDFERATAPDFAVDLTPVRGPIGAGIELRCVVNGVPFPQITWIKDQKPVAIDDRFEQTQDPSTGECKLLIKHSQLSDNGSYECWAVNDGGRTSRATNVVLTAGTNGVTVEPKKPLPIELEEEVLMAMDSCVVEATPDSLLDSKPSDHMTVPPVAMTPLLFVVTLDELVSVLEGDCIMLQTELSRDAKVQWWKDGVPLSGSHDIEMSRSGLLCSLRVKESRLKDSGQYKCKARSGEKETSCATFVNVVAGDMEKPRFVRGLRETCINTGEAVVLEVQVAGRPAPAVSFFKGSTFLSGDGRFKLDSFQDSGVHRLTIESCCLKDVGTYRCIVENELGEASSSCPLKVSDGHNSPQFLTQMQDFKLPEGRDIILKVEVTGKPKPSVEWFFNGDAVKADRRRRLRYEGAVATLTISKATTADEGSYLCVASNDAGVSSSACSVGVLSEQSQPKILFTSRNANVFEGCAVSFHVTFEGRPTPSVTWLKKGVEIPTEDARYNVTTDAGKAVLAIDKALISDAGTYSCNLVNQSGQASTTVKLLVQDSIVRPVFTKELKSTQVDQGQQIVIEASWKAKPRPVVQWFKNDQIVDIDDDQQIFTDEHASCLTIKRSRTTDSGLYKIVVRNEAGEAVSSADVQVTVVAERPKFLKALRDATINMGSSLQLSAIVVGLPAPKITWYRDEKIVFESSDLTPSGNASLVVDDVTLVDAGVYKIEAVNQAGKVTSSCVVSVGQIRSAPCFMTKPSKTTSVVEGASVSLQFLVTGVPTVQLEVLKDNEMVSNNIACYFDNDTGEGVLSVTNASQIDAGCYEVRAENSVGYTSFSIHIKVDSVLRPPRLLSKTSDLSVCLAGIARFEVTFDGDVTDVEWVRNDTIIDESDKYEIIDDENRCVLFINDCQANDEGTYRCEVGNAVTMLDCHVKLSVVSERCRPWFVQKSKDIQVNFKENCELEVLATGIPPPTVEWLKDDQALVETEMVKRHVDNDLNVLVFSEVTDVAAGRYTCVATNELGEARCTSNVQVINRPSAPHFLQPLREQHMVEGQGGRLEVEINASSPSASVMWFRDEDPIDGCTTSRLGDGVFALDLPCVTLDDEGEYKCVVKDSTGESACKAMILVDRSTTAPKFVTKPHNVNIIEGETVVFEIRVTGAPTPAVACTFERSEGEQTDLSDLLEGIEDVSLVLEDCKSVDSGCYRFEAVNQGGKAVCTAQLLVTEVKRRPKIIVEKKEVTTEVAMPTVLNAVISGVPKPVVTWCKDSVAMADENCRLVGGQHQLLISEASLSDAGRYIVKAENELGKVEASYTLTVNPASQAPLFEMPLTDVECKRGADLTLQVTARGYPVPEIQWFKGEKPLRDDSQRTIISAEGRVHTLKLRKTSESTRGRYKAVAKNNLGSVTTAGRVNIVWMNREISVIKGLSDTTCVQGEQLTLSVEVSGDIGKAVWLKNGIAIARSKDITIDSDIGSGMFTLRLSNVRMIDQGKYSVRLSGHPSSKDVTLTCYVKAVQKPIAPSLTLQQRNEAVRTGSVAHFDVKVQGKPLPTITWLKDGTPLVANEKYAIRKVSDSCSLTVKAVAKDDEGRYSCRAENSEGSSTVDASLELMPPLSKPILIDAPGDCDACEKESVLLQVTYDGSPPISVKWTKDGRQVRRTSATRIDKTDKSSTLCIPKATIGDGGKYKVLVTNEAGSVEAICSVSVSKAPVKPSFLLKLRDVNTVEGKPVEFSVRAGGEPLPRFEWYLNDSPIEACDRRHITARTDGKCVLRIKSALACEAGVLKCIATNRGGKAECQCRIKVQEMPQVPDIKPLVLGDVTLNEGDQLKYEVTVTGRPDPTVTWLKNWKELQPSQNVVIGCDGNRHTLIIPHVKTDDQGKYKVVAKNKEGEKTSQSHVTVNATLVGPVFLTPLKECDVKTDESLTLKTEFVATPAARIEWFKDGKKIELATNRIRIDSSSENSILSLAHVTSSDAGKYACVASNRCGSSTTETIVSVSANEKRQPRFVTKLEHATVNSGHQARFIVETAEASNVKFYLNDIEVEPGEHCEIISDQSDHHELVINEVTLTECGLYTCVASNSCGQSECSARLEMLKSTSPPKFMTSGDFESCDLEEGKDIPLELLVVGKPLPTVEWRRDDELLRDDEKYSVIADGERHRLVIRKATVKDSAKYKCIATNEAGRAARTFHIQIEESDTPEQPRFTTELTDVKVERDKPLILIICVTGNPTPTIEWRRNGIALKANYRLKITRDGATGEQKLEIPQFRTSDVGSYSCVATNDSGAVTSKCQVSQAASTSELHGSVRNFKRVPETRPKPSWPHRSPSGAAILTARQHTAPEFLIKPRDKSLTRGSKARFSCSATGHPEPKIEWSRDGNALQSDGRVDIKSRDDVSTLAIGDLRRDDEGDYCVVARNIAGSTEWRFKIILLGSEIDEQSVPERRKDYGVTSEHALEPKLPAKEIKPKPVEIVEESLVASSPSATVESTPVSAPVLLSTAKNQRVTEGENVTLRIEFNSALSVRAKWLKDDRPVVADQRITITEHHSEALLKISSCELDDEAIYKCLLTSSAGSVSSTVEVLVDEIVVDETDNVEPVSSSPAELNAPPSFLTKLKDVAFSSGDLMKLSVQVTGQPTPDVKWELDGGTIEADGSVEMRQVDDCHTLVIKDLVAEDEGEYTCVANNIAGRESCSAYVTVEESRVPPSFEREITRTKVKPGEAAVFTAVVAGKPTPTVSWFHGGKSIDASDKYKITEQDGECTLTISDCDENDTGRYEAVAKSGENEIRCGATLRLLDVAPMLTLPDGMTEDVHVNEGEPLRLRVNISGYPAPTIRWKKNSRTVRFIDRISVTFNEGVAELEIDSVDNTDEGTYSCICENLEGQASIEWRVHTKAVVKTTAPSFLTTLDEMTVVENDKIILSVKFEGCPCPTADWSIDERRLRTRDGVTIDTTDTSSTLTVNSARLEDEGEYRCKIENDNGSCETSCVVLVDELSTPAEFVRKLQAVSVNEGETALFEVEVDGTPLPSVKWLMNDNEIEASTKHRLSKAEKQHSLSIARCGTADKGRVKCVATNASGETSCWADLLVHEVVPQIVASLGEDVVVDRGEDVEINVTVTGCSSVDWFVDEVALTTNGGRITFTADGEKHCLKVRDALPTDAGCYKCVAANTAGSTWKAFDVVVRGQIDSVPEFICPLPEEEIAKFGDTLRLEVQISGSPAPELEWRKDSVSLRLSDRVKIHQSGEVHFLEISDATPKDCGHYTCAAKNTAGKCVSSCDVFVSDRGSSPIIKQELSDAQVKLGGTAEFTVEVSSVPSADVVWVMNDKEVKNRGRFEILEEGDGVFSLFIDDCKSTDSGPVTCRISNKHGEVVSTANLVVGDVRSAPCVIPKSDTAVNVVVGDEVVLEAEVTGKPRPLVEWYRGFRELTEDSDDRLTITRDGNLNTLIISAAAVDDYGTITCVAENVVDKATESFTIKVKAAGSSGACPEVKTSFSDQRLLEGSKMSLEVEVSGSPSPDVLWSFNDVLISKDDIRRTITRTGDKHILAIANVTLNDEGDYKIVATNRIGSASHCAEILIDDEPLPEFLRLTENVSVCESETASFEAEIEHCKEVEWCIDNEVLLPGDGCVISSKGNVFRLEIEECLRSNAGMYSCVAINDAGETSRDVSLSVVPKNEQRKGSNGIQAERKQSVPPVVKPKPTRVKDDAKKPEFTQKPVSRDVFVGSGVEFTCSCVGTPAPKITWYLNEMEVTSSEGGWQLSCDNGISTCTNDKLKLKNQGTIKVTAENSAGFLQATAELKVIEVLSSASKKVSRPSGAPFFKARDTSSVSATIGDIFSFDVAYGGDPSPTVRWAKDGNLVISLRRIKIESTSDVSTVTIRDVTEEDAGVYEVTIENVFGKDTMTIDLNVAESSSSAASTAPASIESEKSEAISDEEQCTVSTTTNVNSAPNESFSKSSTSSEFKIVTIPSDTQVYETERASFEVVLSSSVVDKAEWLREGVVIEPIVGQIEMTQDGRTHRLTFSRCCLDDEAFYEFVAVLDDRRVTAEVELLVDELPDEGLAPTFVKQLPPEIVTYEGDSVSLSVEYSGQPEPTVEWYSIDKKLSNSKYRTIESSKGESRLTIDEAVFEDEGFYKCVISNSHGEKFTETELFVDECKDISTRENLALPSDRVEFEAPSFVKKIEYFETVERASAIFSATVTGTPTPDVCWYLNEVAMSDGGRIQVTSLDQDDMHHMLVIKSCCLDDEGEVKLVAKNEVGKIECVADLVVEEVREKKPPAPSPKPKVAHAAPEFSVELQNRSVFEGGVARLDARLRSVAGAKVRWLFENEPLVTDPFTHIQAISDGGMFSLLFTEARLTDSGTYICEATNNIGQTATSCVLLVSGRSENGVEAKGKLPNMRKSSGMLRLEEALPMTAYVAISDYKPADDGGMPLTKGDVVEVLDTSQDDMWLVRHAARQSDVGFVVPSYLRRSNDASSRSNDALSDEDDDYDDEDDGGDTTDCNSAMDAVDNAAPVNDKRASNTYVAIANYDPQVESGLPLYEGAVVDVMDGGNQKEFWVIRVMKEDGTYGEEGIVPGAYLEKDEQPPATRKRRVSVGPLLIKDDKEKKEAIRFRAKVLKEIIETESKYVDDLKFICKNHVHEMKVCEELPEAIIERTDVLFANLESIYEFHQKTLLPAFQANHDDAEGLANVFFKHAPDLETLYVDYCRSRPRAEKLLNRPEVTEFWEIFQQDIADPYYIQAYLIKPVQRITRYQLLLKELLKYTTRANESPANIESALSTVGAIIRQANDVLHVAKITGFNKGDVDLETVGKLLRHESVTCWEGKAKGRGKLRHLFLFETCLVATKVKEVKKDELEYTFKFAFKMSDAGLTETVEGNSRKWQMWVGKSASSAYQQCTFEAKTVWAKHSWVKDIREILASQLTAMKELPVFLEKLEDIEANEGENVTLSCTVDNCTDVEWSYEMFEIENNNRLVFSNANNNNTYCLLIKKTSIEDAGSYSVTARNSKGRVTSTATLRVSVPARIIEHPVDQRAKRHGNVQFQCSYTGYPATTSWWSFKSSEIDGDSCHVIEKDSVSSTLAVLDCTADDVGVYTCHVKNKVGEVQTIVNLSIADVPSSPGHPTVDHAQATTISLSWLPPEDVSACPVDFYVVEQRNVEDRAEDWNVVAKKVLKDNVVIDNLDADEEFQFRITAVNDFGKSKPSEASDRVYIRAPVGKPVRREESFDRHARDDSSDEDNKATNQRRKKLNRDLRAAKEELSSGDEMDGASLSANGFHGSTKSLNRSVHSSSRTTPTSTGGTLSSSDSESTRKGTGKASLRRGKGRASSPLLYSGTRSSRQKSKSPLAMSRNGDSLSAEDMPIGPPIFTKELEDCFIMEHKAARFKCRVVANPEADIEWFKEGELLRETPQFTMLFDADDFCTMIITEGNTDTAGKYTCVAKNSEGSVASSALLFVEGLATEYETDTEEDVSDPEPLPEKEIISLKKDDVESFYVLKEELGRGKFGVVSKCVDKCTSKEYAAKFIKCRPSERKNIQNEIDIMNSLNHKRLIQLYDAYDMSKRIVLILELVSGGELFEKLTELEFISEQDVTFYMKQVLQGIQHIHDNEILHLDLKPENIMLVSPNSNQVKLIDFGLARRFAKGQSLKVLFGTPEFIAPEVINYEEVTPATDLWSIGVITYVLLSGLSPFMGDNDTETLSNITRVEWDFDDPVFEDISDEAKDFIEDLLVKNQKKRATTKDCFEHPWFKFKKSNKKLKTDRLKAFTARRKWKKTITAVRSTNFLTRLLSGVRANSTSEDDKKQEGLVVKATAQTPSPVEERQVKTPPAVGWKKATLVEEDDEFQAPVFHVALQDVRCIQGNPLEWRVSFSSEQQPSVAWKREGKELYSSSKIKQSCDASSAQLQFTSCKCSDTGRYSVRLENKHGSCETSAQLIVTDVPSATTEPRVLEVTSNSALLQWKPGFDGNSPIKLHSLQIRPLGDHDWSTVIEHAPDCLHLVADLKPGNSYKFRARATNDVGDGPWSETSEFIETPNADNHFLSSISSSLPAEGKTVSPQPNVRHHQSDKELTLKQDNPEIHYNFKDDIGRGKFAVVKRCSHKTTGESFAAKMIKFDDDTFEITKKEFELWQDLSHQNLVALHDAYLVRKYLVLICDIIHGEPVLDYLGRISDLSEDNVAGIVLQFLNVLDYLHGQDIVHLDITPSNVLMHGPNLKLIDYGCAKRIQAKKGDVGEMVGTAEFMAPETINFEPITGAADMWSIGVITYCMLSGVSPFASDDEDESMASITALDYRFPFAAFGNISDEAKNFIKHLIIRIPERRPSAAVCMEDAWLQSVLAEKRQASKIDGQRLLELSESLKEQDKLEEVRASLVLRTFLQSPYQSPESSSSEEGDEDEA